MLKRATVWGSLLVVVAYVADTLAGTNFLAGVSETTGIDGIDGVVAAITAALAAILGNMFDNRGE